MYDIFPEEIPFEMLNKVLNKKALGDLLNEVFRRCGAKATVILSDRLKDLGYRYATAAGFRFLWPI